MKKKYPKSFRDCNALLMVACVECTRGPNGTTENKCAAASRHGECCSGRLLPSIDGDTLRSLPRIIRHKPGDRKTCNDGTPCRGIDKCAGWDTCQGRGS